MATFTTRQFVSWSYASSPPSFYDNCWKETTRKWRRFCNPILSGKQMPLFCHISVFQINYICLVSPSSRSFSKRAILWVEVYIPAPLPLISPLTQSISVTKSGPHQQRQADNRVRWRHRWHQHSCIYYRRITYIPRGACKWAALNTWSLPRLLFICNYRRCPCMSIRHTCCKQYGLNTVATLVSVAILGTGS